MIEVLDKKNDGMSLQDGAAASPLTVEPEQTDPRLHAVAEALEELDRAKTVVETVALACDTIITNFEISGLAVALRHSDGGGYQLSGIWGFPEDLGSFPADDIALFLSRSKTKKAVQIDPKMRTLLPGLKATLGNFFPLQSQGECLGFFLLADTELRKGETMLISMVANAAAARISRIVRDEEQARMNAISGKLISIANTLLQADSKEELYESIVGIACDLIEAMQGSVMVIDKSGKNMQIACSHGTLADFQHPLTIRIGKGIAGRVAQSGEPLLVRDVEKDPRVAAANRPNYKSKSLVCVPLKVKEKIIGVLNLSDKKDLAPFTEGDLETIVSFANLASLMIERSQVLEESIKFEQLSVTDSLTGLYNRRFLKSRVEEELSRSLRQGLNLTLLFIDLDKFKNYNDICGHIAGDEALRKTAEIIKSSLREMDIVARYGGEEFCAVLPATSKAEALIVAERIRKQIEGENFTARSDIPFRRMTASFGVATFPEDGCSYTSLVDASDRALYRAKAAGRNRIVAATPKDSETPSTATEIDHLPAPPAEPSSTANSPEFNAYASFRSAE